MKWHPFAEKFGWIADSEWPAFLESIKATGGNEEPIRYRIDDDGEPEGLDGRNRERACQELGLECKGVQVFVDDADVKAYIIRLNVHRRHLTPEARRAIVAELRADGQSTRQIADTLGVHHTTVVRDIASGGANAPPENVNGTVSGRDGRTYPGKRTSVAEPQEPEYDDVQRHPDEEPEAPPTPSAEPDPYADEGIDPDFPKRPADRLEAEGWLREQLEYLQEHHDKRRLDSICQGLRDRCEDYDAFPLPDALNLLECLDDAYRMLNEMFTATLDRCERKSA